MFDLATAKTRLGIADTSKDVLIGSVLNAAKSIAENYCDRKFDYAAETATFTHPQGNTLSLPRYPLNSIVSVTHGDNATPEATSAYHWIAGTGQIVFDRYLATAHKITVSYTGGYNSLPDDLLIALWRIFDTLWADTPGGGAAVGGAAGGQAINSITIPDVGTIRYESSGASGGSGAGGVGGLIDNVTGALLSFYRREKC
jgi:Phage gp6-like head-tail connector protein